MDAGEHERLRAAAYSRSATTEDVAALADFESRRPIVQPAIDDPVENVDPVPASVAKPSEPETPAPHPERVHVAPRLRARILATAAIALAALVIGVGIGWIVKPAPEARPLGTIDIPADSSLGVFTEPPGADDPMPTLDDASLGAMSVRYLGTFSDHPVFGSLELQEWSAGDRQLLVCMYVEFESGASGGSCTTLAEFLTRGVAGTTSSGAESISIQWGPTGPVRETDGADVATQP
ncbi:hypothetical protein BH11ACT3_BH11ACT3_11540 [soil metagenome]